MTRQLQQRRRSCEAGGSVLKAPVLIVVGAPQRGQGTPPAAEAVMRSGGSVLKAPQRRRGGTPPRSETAKLRVSPLPARPAQQIQKSPYPLPNGRRYGDLEALEQTFSEWA